MTHLIEKSALVAEIDRIENGLMDAQGNFAYREDEGAYHTLCSLENFINSLEVKEVDLNKLGEIARHLIAVKEHVEDMRLDKEEWFMLEKIGYPERFKAQKGEKV